MVKVLLLESFQTLRKKFLLTNAVKNNPFSFVLFVFVEELVHAALQMVEKHILLLYENNKCAV